MATLEATKAKVAALEKELASTLNAELAALPEQYGFASVAAFIKAVSSAGRDQGTAEKKVPTGKKTRQRAKITTDTRAQVKTLVGEGKSGAAIAKALKISFPSVQNIEPLGESLDPRRPCHRVDAIQFQGSIIAFCQGRLIFLMKGPLPVHQVGIRSTTMVTVPTIAGKPRRPVAGNSLGLGADPDPAEDAGTTSVSG